MKASIIDIRYKMKDILKALERKEEVKIMYYGKDIVLFDIDILIWVQRGNKKHFKGIKGLMLKLFKP